MTNWGGKRFQHLSGIKYQLVEMSIGMIFLGESYNLDQTSSKCLYSLIELFHSLTTRENNSHNKINALGCVDTLGAQPRSLYLAGPPFLSCSECWLLWLIAVSFSRRWALAHIVPDVGHSSPAPPAPLGSLEAMTKEYSSPAFCSKWNQLYDATCPLELPMG